MNDVQREPFGPSRPVRLRCFECANFEPQDGDEDTGFGKKGTCYGGRAPAPGHSNQASRKIPADYKVFWPVVSFDARCEAFSKADVAELGWRTWQAVANPGLP